jgi:hypothetical protein
MLEMDPLPLEGDLLQAQSREFKPHYHLKKDRKKKVL